MNAKSGGVSHTHRPLMEVLLVRFQHFHVWVTRFESVGDSVGKITHQNLHVSDPPFFH